MKLAYCFIPNPLRQIYYREGYAGGRGQERNNYGIKTGFSIIPFFLAKSTPYLQAMSE
jgi:hypothetical protein